MKVRMTKTAAGPDGVRLAGKVYEVDAPEAKRLLNASAAIALEPLPAEEIETASVEPEQKAVMPRGRAKGKRKPGKK